MVEHHAGSTLSSVSTSWGSSCHHGALHGEALLHQGGSRGTYTTLSELCVASTLPSQALHGKHLALGENHAHASSPVQPQSGKAAPQQGCSQGFHRALKTESWRGAGVMVARCFLIATDILSSTVSNSASLLGFSGRDSAGSREMSKSRGGSWWVTSPEHAHTLPPWQLSEPSGETLGVT